MTCCPFRMRRRAKTPRPWMRERRTSTSGDIPSFYGSAERPTPRFSRGVAFGRGGRRSGCRVPARYAEVFALVFAEVFALVLAEVFALVLAEFLAEVFAE